jgi:hypothetical protein
MIDSVEITFGVRRVEEKDLTALDGAAQRYSNQQPLTLGELLEELGLHIGTFVPTEYAVEQPGLHSMNVTLRLRRSA